MKPSSPKNDRAALLPIDVGAVTLCLVTGAVLYLAALRPLMVRRADAAAAVGQLATEERQAAALDGQCRRIADRLDRFAERRPDATLKLETRRQLNARLDALIQLAERCDLVIDGVQPRESLPGRYFDVTPIELTAVGSYDDTIVFLRELHRAYSDIAVQAFDLDVIDSNDESGKAECTFELAWYTVRGEQ